MSATQTLEHHGSVVATGEESAADEQAMRLLPLLREYSDKFAELTRDLMPILDRFLYDQRVPLNIGFTAARICLFDTLRKPAEEYAAAAVSLADRAPLQHERRQELVARAFEVEEHLRQIAALISQSLKSSKSGVPRLEEYIEQTGRGSSPIKKYLK